MNNKPLLVGVGALVAVTASWFLVPERSPIPLLAPQATMEPLFRDGFDGFSCQPKTLAPDGLWRKRLDRSQIDYTAMHFQRVNVLLHEWDNIWGCNSSVCPSPAPWPGVTGSSPIFMGFRRDSFIGAHFHTPVNPAPSFASRFVNPTSNPAPPISMSISLECGDFTQFLPTPGCLKQNASSNDETVIYYQFATTGPNTACNLKPDTDYYLNIIQTDPASMQKCNKPNCPVAAWRN